MTNFSQSTGRTGCRSPRDASRTHARGLPENQDLLKSLKSRPRPGKLAFVRSPHSLPQAAAGTATPLFPPPFPKKRTALGEHPAPYPDPRSIRATQVHSGTCSRPHFPLGGPKGHRCKAPSWAAGSWAWEERPLSQNSATMRRYHQKLDAVWASQTGSWRWRGGTYKLPRAPKHLEKESLQWKNVFLATSNQLTSTWQ